MAHRPRQVISIVEPQAVLEGAGVRLIRTIASRALDYLDPFLLLDHFGSDNPDDYLAGFPMHPHRGIETVTYMLAGFVNHRDTLGNSGSIGAGAVQWMTSGRGIMHEEMPQADQGRMAGARWPEPGRYSAVLLCGGGALALGRALKARMDGVYPNVTIAKGAQFSNVHGYLKLARDVWG